MYMYSAFGNANHTVQKSRCWQQRTFAFLTTDSAYNLCPQTIHKNTTLINNRISIINTSRLEACTANESDKNSPGLLVTSVLNITAYQTLFSLHQYKIKLMERHSSMRQTKTMI
jgi:hypothetical protein